MEQENLLIGWEGSIIVARVRGTCTHETVARCQQYVIEMAKGCDKVRILYDTLDMDIPDVNLVLLQQRVEVDTKIRLGAIPMRRAILVSNTRLAYLARVTFGQFGEGQYQVFYDKKDEAIKWLEAPF